VKINLYLCKLIINYSGIINFQIIKYIIKLNSVKMKNYIYTILTFLFFGISLNANAHDFEIANNGHNIYYKITSSSAPYTVAVTYKGSTYNEYLNEYSGAITLPSSVTYNGITYSVTSINNSTFCDCSGVSSVILANSITSIGEYAFFYCNLLTSINFPSSLISIGSYAFKGCSGLTSLVIPNSVNMIGESAFQNCSGLNTVLLSNSINSIYENTFMNCIALTSIVIPNSVDTIGDWAFWDCRKINSITIGSSLKSIGDYAFGYCTSVTSIKTLAVIPPTINNQYTFYSVATNIPVNVPCGASSLYQSALYWQNFTNIVGFQNASTSFTSTICQGATYNLNGFNQSTTGIYTQNLQTTNGCDSVVSLNLTVIPSIITNFVASICQGQSYNQNGFNQATTGVYTQTLKAINGCDSNVYLYLTVNQPITTNINASICQGETYILNGFNASIAGVYTRNLQSINGCDSIIKLNLIVNPKKTNNIIASICQGSTYIQNGFNQDSTGLYTKNLQTTNGCDSIVNLYLIVNENKTHTIVASICQGETYNINGFNVNTQGSYTRNLQTISGCDSIVNLILTVKPKASSNISATICQGETYNLNGFNVSTAGNHVIRPQAANGCDSVVTLNLTVNPSPKKIINASICRGETYSQFGFNQDTSGIYTQTYQSINGCDSTIILNLNVLSPDTNNIIGEICQGNTYTLNGFNENLPGFYTKHLQSSIGCDSTVNLTLIVNQPKTTNIEATICQGETYTLNGFNKNIQGLYTQYLNTYKGCDSIVNLNLNVNNTSATNFNASICQGEIYNQNGFNENSSGVFTHNLKGVNGCDSIVTLNLIVNPVFEITYTEEICQGEIYNQNGFNEDSSGTYIHNLQTINGCDSIVKLILTVNNNKSSTITASICQGETYTLNGFNEDSTGFYTQNLQSYKGCDSIINLDLTVNPKKYNNLYASICQGEIYNQNGFNENSNGIYTQNLQTTKGCDSIVTLNLTVNPIYVLNINEEICQGSSYTLNGFNENTSGSYTQNLQTINGCDSIINLNLLVNQNIVKNINAEICQGEFYTLNGFNASTNGTHTQNLQSYKGCDSIINLTLKVNPTSINNINAEICQGEIYTQSGFNANASGTYTQSLQTIKGCDSIINLNLVVNSIKTTNIDGEICDGEVYTENGFDVRTTGLYSKTLQTEKGCDSIINLSLTVRSKSITNYSETICEGETFTQYGFNENTSGIFSQNLQTINGCDSTITLNLTITDNPPPSNLDVKLMPNNLTITWEGNGDGYIVLRNNDSIAFVTIPIYVDINVVNNQAYCYKIKSKNQKCLSEYSDISCKGFINQEAKYIKIYPNPTKGFSSILIKNIDKGVNISITDVEGRIIYRNDIFPNTNNIIDYKVDLSNYPKGIYYLKLINDDINTTQKMIVQ